jgi:hypothetical protein
MAVDPLIARPYIPDVSNTLGEIARTRVADNYRNALLAQDQQRFAYQQQKDQAANQQLADEQKLRETYAEIEMYANAPPAIKAQYVETQKQKYPNFAQTPFASMPPEQAFEAMRRGLAAKLGMTVPQAPGPIQSQRIDGATFYTQDGKVVANRMPPSPQQHAPESFQPFTQADGSVVLLGSRGSQRPTNLRGKVPPSPVDTKTAEKAASNQQAWGTYSAAMSGLTAAMAATETGPIAGRFPAFTAAQQTADGAVAAMAPVLKQLFRTAGEGTFTDKDQQLLLAMVPTRADRPEARANKIANINRIVQAKLGIQSAPESPPPDQGGGLTPEEQAELEMLRKKYGRR